MDMCNKNFNNDNIWMMCRNLESFKLKITMGDRARGKWVTERCMRVKGEDRGKREREKKRGSEKKQSRWMTET